MGKLYRCVSFFVGYMTILQGFFKVVYYITPATVTDIITIL